MFSSKTFNVYYLDRSKEGELVRTFFDKREHVDYFLQSNLLVSYVVFEDKSEIIQRVNEKELAIVSEQAVKDGMSMKSADDYKNLQVALYEEQSIER